MPILIEAVLSPLGFVGTPVPSSLSLYVTLSLIFCPEVGGSRLITV
jgi:hypothetical protein